MAGYLKQLLDTNQLKDQEYFVLISWQDTYKSRDFMGHPNLELDTSLLPSILDDQSYKKALDGFLDFTSKKVALVLNNVLDKNFKEWLSNDPPLLIEGYYESIMPNDVSAIILQKVNLKYT